MREEKIIVKITPVEKRFLDFCRSIVYAEFTCVVMKGEPIKALAPIKSVRFDLPIDNYLGGAMMESDKQNPTQDGGS